MTSPIAADKTPDEHFRDWESHAFGFGYGTGEPHTLAALKTFLAAIPERPYDYEVLERACGATVAWLLINALCRVNIIEYGTSPRYGWLTTEGQTLKAYVDMKSVDELLDAACGYEQEYVHCYPDHCNCDGAPCNNPFWKGYRK